VRIVRWVIAAFVAVLLVIFAISNRQNVEVTFWPFPVTIDSALSLIVLGAVVIAFLVGQFVAWLGAQRWRNEARAKQRRIEALERELAATQVQLRPPEELVAGRITSSPLGERKGPAHSAER
jgi:uncharacterized integral membrane protein